MNRQHPCPNFALQIIQILAIFLRSIVIDWRSYKVNSVDFSLVFKLDKFDNRVNVLNSGRSKLGSRKPKKQSQRNIDGYLDEPGQEKMCLMSYANNKGADQPAHSRSLISAFVVRCLDSTMSLDSIAEISRL